jgi:hypothetical protein
VRHRLWAAHIALIIAVVDQLPQDDVDEVLVVQDLLH